MKRLLFMAALAAAISCQPEEKDLSHAVPAENELQISATAGSLFPEWQQGDSLTVIDNAGLHTFKALGSGTTAIFSGTAYPRSKARVAVYPCVEGEDISLDNLLLPAAPAEQKGFAPMAAACSAGKEFALAGITSAISFSIVSDDVVSVLVEAVGGEPLSGDALLSITSSQALTVEYKNGASSVLLLPAPGESCLPAGENKITCLPGSFASGLHFSVVRSDDRLIETTTPAITVQKGKEVAVGVVEDGTAPELVPVDIALVIMPENAETISDWNTAWPFESPSSGNLSNSFGPETGSYVGEEKEFVMKPAEGGYVFKIFSAYNGIAKNSTQALRFGGKEGDYVEFPLIRGLYLNTVKVDCGNIMSSYQIEKADGTPIKGGNVTSYFGSVGSSFSWSLYGSERSTAYRMVCVNENATAFRRIYLHYDTAPVQAPQGNISPLDYGLREATNGVERLDAIRNAHLTAAAIGTEVDYTGVGTVDLEISAGAAPIPVTNNTDFKGTVFNVKNTVKDIYLFSKIETRKSIVLSGRQIDSKDFSSIPELRSGLFILRIEDGNPWVLQREGRDYSAVRRDVILIENGIGKNGPIAPYDTPASQPVCSYRAVDTSLKTFGNVTLNRVAGSTFKTYLGRFDTENNLKLHNITINTPDPNGLISDSAIYVINSTNLLMEDVTVNGSYSKTDEYGYGISLNAIWNGTFRRITSHTNWGVFGNNNNHDSLIENCDIDRYDIHCYGRNITIRNSKITGRGLSVSSVYGTILLEHNEYVNCHPYNIRSDYYCYVPMDLIIRDCEVTTTQPRLFGMGRLDTKDNERPELLKKNWNNLTIEGLKVHIPAGASEYYIYYPTTANNFGKPLGYLSSIDIKGLEFIYPSGATSVKVKLSSADVQMENNVDVKITDCKLAAPGSTDPVQFVLNIKGPQNTHTVVNSDVTIVE